jgi:glycosyltransferase involved in cell wall biosynthesis
MSKKYYIYFTNASIPKEDAASLIHDVNSANAAANLGYNAALVCIDRSINAYNPVKWIFPFNPKKPSLRILNFYNVSNRLKIVKLPMPWLVDSGKIKFANSQIVASKYYFPFHILKKAAIVHTMDFLIASEAIKKGVPVIFEREHFENFNYPANLINNELLQVVITVAENVKQNLIKNGMPPKKIHKLHIGLNSSFLKRELLQAANWRNRMLKNGKEKLILYSGGLYKFKGVDLILEVAKKLPDYQFVLAGAGCHFEEYQNMVKSRNLKNVELLGYVPHSQLVGVLQAADILIHPHLSGKASTFTSPLKFFEYMASGVPVATSEILPLKEFKNKKLAINWCKPDCVSSFAQCIEQTLKKYPRKEKGYIQNIQFAKQFTWEKRIEKILSFVEPRYRPEKDVGL